ncbi:hypothetical protein T8K17_13940 [Thalassobaculum sp. OXR-137]|uniref:polysaccharide lyase n=1 Tax=Thalassobaculum sp. OXR-137 TaxID=3100173 RepID=UPI002AC8A0D5|nr:hypothetical protein [Thalassobaculum sp. OXR-137]WPZ32341.1 hypothetical protein T8K17_13940 [Thalassobaculum sp. OXR-137]
MGQRNERLRSILSRRGPKSALPVLASLGVTALVATILVAGPTGTASSGGLPKIDKKASEPTAPIAACAGRYDRVWSLDLPADLPGTGGVEDALAKRALTMDRVWGLDENVTVSSGENGGRLTVRYPKDSINPSSKDKRPLGGAGFVARLLPDDTERACLRYRVRFEDGFAFVRGGKLPGLYGGEAPSGGEKVDGTKGFSMRLMWRRDGEGEVYAYVANKQTDYGASIGRGNWSFEPGRWMEIQQEVVLNDPDRADGIVRVWIDGKQVIEQTDLVYRTVADAGIDGLMFSTFFGGSSRKWASPKDQTVDFDSIELFAGGAP